MDRVVNRITGADIDRLCPTEHVAEFVGGSVDSGYRIVVHRRDTLSPFKYRVSLFVIGCLSPSRKRRTLTARNARLAVEEFRHWASISPTHRFKRGEFVKEAPGQYGIILDTGAVTFTVVWVGGMTSRYRYSVGRKVRRAPEDEIDRHTEEHLRAELKAAREERRTGARIKRGAVHPSR